MEELGLNIIADATVAVAIKPPRKKKRNNKYDKRRRKAARAKLEQQQEQEQAHEPEIQDQVEVLVPVETHEHSSSPSQEPEIEIEPIAEKKPEEEEIEHANIDDADTNDQIHIPSSSGHQDNQYVPPLPMQPPLQSQMSPEDEAAHAAYMAEFHARPLELDRRSGARALQRRIHYNQNDGTHEEDGTESSMTWSDLYDRWHPKLQAVLTKHYPHPTTIQSRVFRAMNNHHQSHKQNDNHHQPHVWIQSETGSGKTLAYFVPLFQRLLERITSATTPIMTRQSVGTTCLIVCPTQELVQQTHHTLQAVVNQCCAGTVVVGSLMGQESRSKEKARLRKGLGVLVSTPGRLLDHLQTTVALQTALQQGLAFVVLDEVDRLFDLGLAPQLTQVLELVTQYTRTRRSSWQCILVSATVPQAVRSQVQECLSSTTTRDSKTREWLWIQNDDDSENQKEEDHPNNTADDDSMTEDHHHHHQQQQQQQRSLPKHLVQYHVTVSAKLRLSTLVAFLLARIPNKERAVVFLSTCASVDYYHALFQAMDCVYEPSATKTLTKNTTETGGIFGAHCPVYKLHGNVPHAQRHQVLQEFVASSSNSSSRVLLATDVAARGLNLKTDWTVQFDPPCEIADYIHRAGRVARAGQAGQSVLFLLPSERGLLPLLGQLQLQQKQQSEKSTSSKEKAPTPADLAGGGSDMVALSLTSTLQQASKLSPHLTREGVSRNGGGRSKPSDQSSRHGGGGGHREAEAFCSELQYRLEECVLQQSALTNAKNSKAQKAQKGGKRAAPEEASLLEMARNAFLAYMRAYPTKEKLVRHIFSARALHLGHVAKSFALREPPKVLVRNSKKQHQQLAMAQPKTKQGKKSGNPHGKKRNAALAFGGAEDVDGYQMKDTSKARALLMANAAKLQTGGIDGF